MEELLWLVVFAVDQQRFAVPLAHVRQVVLAAEPRAVPGAPPRVRGLLDLHGEPIAVVDLAQRVGAQPRELSPDHQFIVVDAPGRTVALWVDDTCGVECRGAHEFTEAEGYAGATAIDGDLVLIHDVASFLRGADGALFDAAADRVLLGVKEPA